MNSDVQGIAIKSKESRTIFFAISAYAVAITAGFLYFISSGAPSPVVKDRIEFCEEWNIQLSWIQLVRGFYKDNIPRDRVDELARKILKTSPFAFGQETLDMMNKHTDRIYGGDTGFGADIKDVSADRVKCTARALSGFDPRINNY